MKRSTAAAAVFVGGLAVLALVGCDKAKPRHLPPDPFATPPPAAQPAATPTEGLSAGLAKRGEMPGFFLDHIGAANDPMNKPPAVTPAGQPILLDGFGFDPVAKLPAQGVDVVIDGKAWGARYGHDRPDVAKYFKTPALAATGFRTTLPAGTLPAGAHTARLRIVAADGKGYFESPAVAFTVQ
jgi:hypothetical protein